jgi:hippurate hydrolase
MRSFADRVAEIEPEITALRRRIHRRPEIGLRLPETQRAVLEALDGLGLEVSAGGEELTSVVAVLRGDPEGPVVLLRADMDALPLDELSGETFTSELPGVMHACGHDLHVAGLVGAAKLLATTEARLAGDIVFMFQPGEEGYDGAARMIEAGVLEACGRPVDAAYGIHVRSSQTPRGCFAGRGGPLMAASDTVDVRVVGSGGHGSMPFAARDPIPATAEMLLALQTIVSRRTNPFDPVVVTVGTIQAGTKATIIPDDALFSATIRSFSDRARRSTLDSCVQICEAVAGAHGLAVEVTVTPGYPATVNDPAEFEFAAETVTDLFGHDRFERWDNPIFGSEDFSRVLQAVPGAYVFLGACPQESYRTAVTNHSPRARFDDSVIPDAAVLLAELAVRRLNRARR